MKNIVFSVLEDSPIMYYPVFAKKLKSVTAAVLLSNLFRWQGKGADPNGWIYKTGAEMTDETGLSRHEQDSAINTLMAAGILEYKVVGSPPVRHFRINEEKFLEYFSEDIPERKTKTASPEAAIPQEYQDILETWNQNGPIKHTPKWDKARLSLYRKALNSYSKEAIQQAIVNYGQVLAHPETYYFTYKYTLWDFLKNNIHKFADQNYLQYRKNKTDHLPKNKEKKEAEDESINRAKAILNQLGRT